MSFVPRASSAVAWPQAAHIESAYRAEWGALVGLGASVDAARLDACAPELSEQELDDGACVRACASAGEWGRVCACVFSAGERAPAKACRPIQYPIEYPIEYPSSAPSSAPRVPLERR